MPTKTQTARNRDFAQKARATAADERAIQRQVDRKERASSKEKTSGAMQAGARAYPEPPLPAQHLGQARPRARSRTRTDVRGARLHGSDKLLDMVALITGGDSGIGRVGRGAVCARGGRRRDRLSRRGRGRRRNKARGRKRGASLHPAVRRRRRRGVLPVCGAGHRREPSESSTFSSTTRRFRST